MHKWKLFKKSAALVLSSAVIASGVPVTAMASEAEVFSDVSEETQGETAQEEGENEDQESVSQDRRRYEGTLHFGMYLHIKYCAEGPGWEPGQKRLQCNGIRTFCHRRAEAEGDRQ